MNRAVLVKEKSRALWEEVFAEDEAKFLDYYDSCVAGHNRIYLDEEDGQAVSMLHCNPYTIRMGDQTAEVSFIVAVATREAYRHQGRMRRLLQTALQDSYLAGEPFVYLMPASEQIYLPFGFRTVAHQNVLTLGSIFQERSQVQGKPELRAAQYSAEASDRIFCRRADYRQLTELAEFSKRVLSNHCAVYTEHSVEYFQRIWKEQEAVNGGILLFYRDSELLGYCFSGLEGSAEVWELVLDPVEPEIYVQALHAVTEFFREALPIKINGLLPGATVSGIESREFAYRPMTMVRITNLISFAEKLCASEKVDMILNVTDTFLPQNSGRFRLLADSDGGTLEALQKEDFSERKELDLTIEELTDLVFGKSKMEGFPSDVFKLLRPVYLNELV